MDIDNVIAVTWVYADLLKVVLISYFCQFYDFLIRAWMLQININLQTEHHALQK